MRSAQVRAAWEVEGSTGRTPKPTWRSGSPPQLPVPQGAPVDVPILSAEVVHYYLYCDQSLSSPFQQVQGGWAPPWCCLGLGGSVTAPHSPLQALTVFQRSLTTMQIQIQGLIQYALPLFPTAEVQEWGAGHLHPSFCSPELPDPPFSHRKTCWESSSSSTPQRPACTS